ncbi:MAG TPA: hypothetical protein VGD65_20080, partial [Chryseosolibacter sp.]
PLRLLHLYFIISFTPNPSSSATTHSFASLSRGTTPAILLPQLKSPPAEPEKKTFAPFAVTAFVFYYFLHPTSKRQRHYTPVASLSRGTTPAILFPQLKSAPAQPEINFLRASAVTAFEPKNFLQRFSSHYTRHLLNHPTSPSLK